MQRRRRGRIVTDWAANTRPPNKIPPPGEQPGRPNQLGPGSRCCADLLGVFCVLTYVARGGARVRIVTRGPPQEGGSVYTQVSCVYLVGVVSWACLGSALRSCPESVSVLVSPELRWPRRTSFCTSASVASPHVTDLSLFHSKEIRIKTPSRISPRGCSV